MLNTSDRLLATDQDKCVDLYVTAADQAYLLHRHLKLGRCLLPSPYLAHALHTIQRHGQEPMTLNLELRPKIPGLIPPVPFMAFIGAGKRIVLGYVPGLLAADDVECVFGAFPALPVVVCDTVEFFANRHVYDRVMGEPERN
jgi:hypothetical protein